MIIKAHQRGGGKALALYLLHNPENEIVEVHDLRGFMAEDLVGALVEIDITARGTRCPRPLFSLSFNPPPGASVSIDAFEKAFAIVERRFGLQAQSRAVVFHEKQPDNGPYRRHAHVVYSRITDASGRLKALELGPYKRILQRASREIFHELGIEAPAGYADRDRRDPRNFDRKVWQQAKRIQEDPRDLKALLRELFLRSRDRASFEKNLAAHALFLAKGDRRGHVIVHHSAEIISLSKYSGIKTKDLTARLGPADALPPVLEVQQRVKAQMQGQDKAAIRRRIEEAKARQQEQLKFLRGQIDAIKLRHRQERAVLYARQHEEWKAGQRERGERLRRGVIGLFDRVSGQRTRLARQNARERDDQKAGHGAQKQALIDRQHQERDDLHATLAAERQVQKDERQALGQQLAAAFDRQGAPEAPGAAPAPEKTGGVLRETFDEAAAPQRGEPGYAEWRQAQREITRDRRKRGESGREGRGRERGGGDGRGRERGGRGSGESAGGREAGPE